MDTDAISRQTAKPRAVTPTGCRKATDSSPYDYCAIREMSLVHVKGRGQDFWNYWVSKGLKIPERYYTILDVSSEGSVAYNDMPHMCPVFREKLVPNYDVGVGIAKGAMVFSYMLERHGLPMLIVKQHADHSTPDGKATWEPIDKIDEETIGGKDVLVVDLDVFTGKTVKRAADELRKFEPRKLDLFLRLGPIREINCQLFLDEDNNFCSDMGNGLDTRTRIPRGPQGFDEVLFYEELSPPPQTNLTRHAYPSVFRD